MYLKRNSKDCNIYNRFFIDDLQKYEVVEDITIDSDSTLYLKFLEPISWSTGTIRSADLLTIINSNRPDSPYDDIWLPAILDTSTYMNNKEVLMGHVIDNTVYGIESAMSFSNPVFQNWTVSPTPAANKPTIDIDWKINSNLSPSEIFYGALFWYKKNTNPASATTFKLKELPNNSKIYCTQQLSYTKDGRTYTIPANQIVFKKNNSLLQLIKKTEVDANHNSQWFEFSMIPNLEDSSIFKSFGMYNSISSDLKDYTLWISSGEAFSFYNGFRDRHKRNTKGILSRSYISPGLYPIYRAIYNALTIRQSKSSSGSGLTKTQSAKLKKLCYFLSSSPLIDRVTINYLTDINLYNTIYSSYINAANGTSEKKDLINIINTIFNYYKGISADLDQQTSGHNIIRTKSDLFLKLSKKYCPYIRVASPITSCKFTYNSVLSNGAHAYFNFGLSSHTPNNTSTTTIIFNNFDLTVGNILLQTNNSTTNSECKFFYVNDDDSTIEMTPPMPLADIAFKRPDKVKINLGDDANISMGTSFEKIHTITGISSTDSTDTDTFWFLSEGKDCLRFSDYNRFPGAGSFLNRLRSSTQTDPDIYLKQTGLFSVDCVHSQSNALKKSDTIDIYVNGGSALTYPADPAVINEYKTMCPNIRQIGINKRGMIWFVDTDMYVCKLSVPTAYEKEERCIDTKIGLEYFTKLDANGDRLANIYNSDASCNFVLRPNNTVMKLTYLSIEHLRDRDAPITQGGETRTINLADCKSCYEEKIVRERDRIFGPTIGAARYYRIGPNDGISLYKYKTDDNITWYKDEDVEFKLPTASTAFAPRIPSYGGYSQEVIKNIGVDIPYHPISVNGSPTVNQKTPAGTVWDCPTGFSCSDPAYMPSLIDRNDMGGNTSNRRCRLVDIPVTGCTTFTKGYFDTKSGWIPHTSAAYSAYNNKSSVQKYKTDDYESYILKGYGFLDLKSAFDTDHSTNLNNNFRSSISINSFSTSVGSSEHSYTYGYRNPNMNILQETDDFVVYEDTESRVDFNCSFAPNISYSFIDSTKLSTLKIKDLEVKINFINYPNPKQLIVYLDVTYDSSSPVTEDTTDKIFKNYLSSADVASDTPNGFSAYYTAIVSMNNTTSGKRLYLLNRDNIDNYGYNFSMCFSDDVGINHVTTDYNKVTYGPTPSQYIIHNGDKIRPTLSPFGYNDIDIAKYRNILANNNMSIYEASFAKFRNIPLAGAKFTLNVEVVDQHDNVTIKDNLMNNNELSGLTNIEHKETSNNIANSICSWEVIVHTQKVKKFVPSDVLGYINYNNPSTTYDGYSFIADLTDKQYMVPPVNLNAPFPYLSNINSCKFIDDYEQSRGMTYQQIKYPTTFLYFTPFFSVVGGLVAIAQLQAVFGAGGRADPIINMFLDLKFQRQQEELERNYFQPVYDGYGYANKAVILASKDQATWYQMEVPIFRLSNCPILEENKYKYIKLKKNMALGRFIVKRVTDIKELIDMSEIAAIITEDPATLSGLSITTNNGTNVTLKPGDLVHVKNSTLNDIYSVDTGGWTLAPDVKSAKFCAYNKAIKNMTLTKAYVSSRQLFIIAGARAYYYFDKNDNIDMRYLTGSSETNTVIEKALLLINGEYKTVLTLGTTVNMDIGEITKPDGDVNTILIYKDHVTRNDNIKVGKWSTNKSGSEKALNFHIDRHPAVFGEGSIGYGTNQLEPDLLADIKLKFNSIEDTSKILDGVTSNKLRYNTVTVNGADITFDPASDDAADLLYGYSYSLFDFGLDKPEALIQKDILKQEDLDKIKAIISGNVMVSSNNKNPLFMDLKSDKFKNIADSGEIIINRDYNAKISTYSISESKKAVMALRIAKLIELIGAARKEYANMEDDPPDCNSVDGIGTECPKKDKLQEIQSYSSEKDFLRSLINNASSSSAWSNQSIIFTPTLSDSLTGDQITKAFQLMNTKTETSTKAELLTALNMTEENYDTLIALAPNTKINASFQDKDHYWINIDKDQYCSIAQEASAKVLKKVTYRCTPVVEYYQYPACNPVCGNGNSKDIIGTDENIKQDAIEMEYKISAEKIAEEKAKYPSVTEWVDSTNSSSQYYVFEKKFFMSCGDENGAGDDTRDTLVTVNEYYEFPKKPNPASYKVKDVFNLDGNNSVYIKFKNIPRKLKTIDPIYTLYNYDYNGNLGKSTRPSPGGPISNNFCVWQCYGFDDDKPKPDGDPFYGKIIEPPDFYKLQNEMIFRAFFGSVDGTEHKNSNISNTKEMWEWIPYEYFNSPIIEPP